MRSAPRAVLLAVICNGLGHLYAGSLRAAIAVHVAWLAATGILMGGLLIGPRTAALAATAPIAVWIGQIAHSALMARRGSSAPRRWWSGPLGLVAFYVATVVVAQIAWPLRTVFVHTVYVPAGSMVPTVQIGDVLVVAAGRPRALRGAVVELAPPQGAKSRDNLLKRVVGVGGDKVEVRAGVLWVNGTPVPRARAPGECSYFDRSAKAEWREERCLEFVEELDGRAVHTYCSSESLCGDASPQIVPPSQIWVMGDHRDRSLDSRYFGPVPESSIVGEVKWVVLSWGPSGLRWERTGVAIQ